MDRSCFRLDDIEKTWIFDLDGTLVVHNGYKGGMDTLLPGVKDFYMSGNHENICQTIFDHIENRNQRSVLIDACRRVCRTSDTQRSDLQCSDWQRDGKHP